MYVEHPLIMNNAIEKRAYQTNIAAACMKRSTLVVLPTGMGKTIIALLVIADRLLKEPDKKVLFMAPTKPLVDQHSQFMMENLKDEPRVSVFTGEVAPAKRQALWEDSQIVLATPQVISNDLVSGRLDLSGVSLIIYDEAHRAVGDYAYVFVAERFRGVKGLALGITASPGADTSKILEVCGNLDISGVEIRSKYDADVVNYVHEIKINWSRVDLPKEYASILDHLGTARNRYFKELRRYGFLKGGRYVSTKDILIAGKQIRERLKGKVKSPSLFQAASVQAQALKVNHAMERLETQGITAFNRYMDRLVQEANSRGSSKASKAVLKDPDILRAIELAKGTRLEHPKLAKLQSVVLETLGEKPDAKMIVFTHYRDMSILVEEALNKRKGVRAVRFVGQASKEGDKGLRQKEQIELIQRFKDGEFNVLVATSVAEEGLDIPSTDMVVFYEPVPSEIRTIQRRGRTGRKMPGKVVILIARKTRDEAYYWSSLKKEKGMHRELEAMRSYLRRQMIVGEPVELSQVTAEDLEEERERLEPGKKETKSSSHGSEKRVEPSAEDRPRGVEPPSASKAAGQKRLFDFGAGEDQRPMIIADNREFNSQVVKELARQGVIVTSGQLDVADYVISDRVGVERKEVGDFLSSLMDGRLFPQAKALARSYMRPIIIIEGEGLLTKRNISESAIMGALASLLSDFGIPIMFTTDGRETALMLASLAKRERKEGREVALRAEKGSMNMRERQQFILEGLPGVSAVMAQRLLSHFHSIHAIANAPPEELAKVKGIGKKTAESIAAVFRERYD